MRRGEQVVHHPLIGIGPLVLGELLNLGGRRRQAQQVQTQAANKYTSVRLGRWLDPQTFQLGKHKGIDGSADPVALVDRWDRWTLYRLE